MQNKFRVSDYMVRTAKYLVNEKRILPTPNLKPEKTLHGQIFKAVIDLYNNKISRVMPYIKDFVSVKSAGGTRIHLQKRWILAYLKEIYQMFKKEQDRKC